MDEWVDTDSDGIGNNEDTDDDGDSWEDALEPNCGADPLDVTSTPIDDSDGTCDYLDPDDNDGTMDADDDFPVNPDEQTDTDEDGIGNNEDNDDDGDVMMGSLCDTSPIRHQPPLIQMTILPATNWTWMMATASQTGTSSP